MRRVYASLVAMTLACVLVLTPAPAQAETGCVIDVLGIKVCGELLGQPLPPVITVTVRPDPIQVPGPTETVTVRPPPVTETVPGPPGPTVTVTEPAQPQTVGPTPNAVPGPTETVTVSPPGQPDGDDDTIVDNTPGPPAVDFGDGDTTIVEAGIGFLTLLALVGLLLIALYAGYILGYKDRERKDTNFMRALLDSVKSR